MARYRVTMIEHPQESFDIYADNDVKARETAIKRFGPEYVGMQHRWTLTHKVNGGEDR